jgi:ribonuclease J
MVCDSTNAMVEGEAGSEGEVQEGLLDLVAGLENRVAVGCFASNIARLESLGKVARKTGRRVCLAGRSLKRMLEAAQESGYLLDFPAVVAEDEVGYLPRNEVLLICTGSQGEPRAALSRIARGEHQHIALEEGDAVVFSSRVIPGNEVGIFALQNQLAQAGVGIHTDREHDIHVSGHPAREELAQMYQWVRPQVAIPVHGEARHLLEHAKLAEDCQVPQAIVCQNGDMIRLAPGPCEIVEQVTAGRLALDGEAIRAIESEVLRERVRMLYNGAASLTLVMDAAGNLAAPPQLSCRGLLDEELEADELDAAEAYIERSILSLRRRELLDDEAVIEAGRIAVRRFFRKLSDKKPVTDVHLVRLD